jgi:cysteine desulfurase
MNTIYLDNNATTSLDPVVAKQLSSCYQSRYMNPASQHAAGRRARQVLEDAREELASVLGAGVTQPGADQVVFTSGATEANNLALLGLALDPHGHALVSHLEHPSVVEPARILESRGVDVEWVPVLPSGIIDVSFIQDRIRKNTQIVTIMLGNNQTGIIQPVREVVELCRNMGVPVHCDAAQAAGKIHINFRDLGVSTLSVAAHKFHGPRGIGALVVRDEVAISPLLSGGSQQLGIRPGTESVCLALGMTTALSRCCDRSADRENRLRDARDRFERMLCEQLPTAVVIGNDQPRLPQTSCIAFPPHDRQAVVMALDLAGIACSTGSACTSGSSEPSPVLLEMGLEKSLVESAVRFSFGADNDHSDADQAAQRISSVINGLGHRKQA